MSLNLLKSTGTGASLSMFNLSTSVFRLAKFVFSTKLELSMCVTFFNQFLLHRWEDTFFNQFLLHRWKDQL